MDYKQRYEDALKRAKAMVEVAANQKEAKGYVSTIFPELRESERIRKGLIAFLKRYHTGQGEYQPFDEDWISWLEKQKEGEKEVAELFDSTDSYNKGFRAGQEKALQELKEHIKEDKTQCYAYDAGYAAGFIVGKEQGWKEHKAFVKENSKNAISIPADCASNAKCEDRWHNVADSLPNTPREVLCKDYIGNYFIGRYYEGSYEGSVWEVSVYDDEDKTNENNPEVVMWCEIPFEKQKEQKPADEDKEYDLDFAKQLKEIQEAEKEANLDEVIEFWWSQERIRRHEVQKAF